MMNSTKHQRDTRPHTAAERREANRARRRRRLEAAAKARKFRELIVEDHR